MQRNGIVCGHHLISPHEQWCSHHDVVIRYSYEIVKELHSGLVSYVWKTEAAREKEKGHHMSNVLSHWQSP